MTVFKVKLKDSVSVSEPGGDSGSGGSSGSSGGGGIRARLESERRAEENRKNKEQQRLARELAIEKARQEKATRDAKRQAEEDERKARKKEGETPTGVFVEGGAVVQKTTGKLKDLQRLESQRPNSKIIQTADGKFTLIEARGLNLSDKQTFDKFRTNRELEGRSPIFSEREIGSDGGATIFRRIKDEVAGGEDQGGFVESPGGKDFSINFGGGSSEGKPRPKRAGDDRLIAEGITAGTISNQFLGRDKLTNVTAEPIRTQ